MTNTEKLRELLGSMTLQEAKDAGISAETYVNLIKSSTLAPIWRPKMDDKYYCLRGFAENIEVGRHHWENDSVDNFKLQQGYICKTKEQAEKVLELKQSEDYKLARQIENYVICNDDGWRADWDNLNQEKYFLHCKRRTKEWEIGSHGSLKTLGLTYMSEDMANTLRDILNNSK